MSDYATVSDLEDRWRPLTPDEEDQADVLLDDAATIIRAALPGVDTLLDAGDLDPAIPLMVSCSIVKRVMSSSDVAGVDSTTITTGPFSQALTYSNPQGNLYLSKADKRLLGVGGQVAFTIDQAPADDTVYVVESITD